MPSMIFWKISKHVPGRKNKLLRFFAFSSQFCYYFSMKHLAPSEYPKDFYYHRTSAEIYKPYLESCGPITTIPSSRPHEYAWKKKLFGGVYVARFERTDVEPDIEALKTSGVKHAMVTWIPYSRTDDIPKGWKRLYLTDHFQETSVNLLDENYKTKWNERSRRALKKFEKSEGEVRVVDAETFIDAFENTSVKHIHLKLIKSDYIRNYKRIRKFAPEKVRQWLVYRDGKPVAGLACLDYLGNHSAHFVAFTGRESYDIQWGTGLIDAWFADSLAKWIKYITFDQLRNPHGPKDQKWYTEFKENFIEYRLSFPKAYFKVF